MEYNWKRWKNVKLAGGVKERLTAVYKVVKKEKEKIEEWIEEDEIGQMV